MTSIVSYDEQEKTMYVTIFLFVAQLPYSHNSCFQLLYCSETVTESTPFVQVSNHCKSKNKPNSLIFSVVSLQNDPICLSCSFEYKNCTCFDAKFSENGKFYVLYCLGPGVPKAYLRSVFDSETSTIRAKMKSLEKIIEE